MRDFIQWLGSLEVCRPALINTLKKGNIAMLVPGGQGEISSTRSWGRDIAMCRKHVGFVRCALSAGAHLIPTISFGEWTIMDNVYWPFAQALTRRLWGFPFPFLPYGALPCMPRRAPLRIVVGQPIPAQRPSGEEPTDAEVNAAADEYYKTVEKLFEDHKGGAGFDNLTLRWL